MKARADLTFKHNLKKGRHGWLRLTPAYSIKVVRELLSADPSVRHVLDPFSGTGTTGLVCAELGLACDLLDVNPFLVWLARVKTANYSLDERLQARNFADEIVARLQDDISNNNIWLPPIKNIERWWPESKRQLLGQIYKAINEQLSEESPAKNLLLIAFCRIIIEWSNAAFNHQSMSFKEGTPIFSSSGFNERTCLLSHFKKIVEEIVESAAVSVEGQVKVARADSRTIVVPRDYLYDCVITSPPYPNRMSYIRELRPYMYWLGFINEAREAGELDWQAMGGTWGIATSRVARWQADGARIRCAGFYEMINEIGRQSQLLANYVHKYFVDALAHLCSVHQALAADSRVFYVVGNSKFYNTLVPVDEIYASLLKQSGFKHVRINIIRKRNSKKELYEMVVSAKKT